MQFIYLYLVTLPLLAIIDLAFIGGVAKPFYKAQLGGMLSSNPIWWAVVIFYLLYVAGIVFFVIAPAIEVRSLVRAIVTGAFFGLIAYGTYDLTNLATTTGWPALVTYVDMAWGTFAGGAISGIAYLIATGVFGL